MPRKPRIDFPGAIHHVASRGDRREAIFLDDTDRLRWLETVAAVCRTVSWRLHAWCLMDNHYHIVLESKEAPLSEGMRQLNGAYTHAFNRRHGRSGHVFQGRFHAELIAVQSHLLEVVRYVVLNPVRAALVARPQDWEWSNYRSTAGMQAAPAWLDVEWTLANFGCERAVAMERYRRFVAEGMEDAGSGRRPDPYNG